MNQAILQDPFGLTGTVLDGQYRVEEIVGEGGFGVVYRGRHLSLDQPIAVKALKGLDGGDAAINELVHEKFREEARLLYTLSQSSLHIVRSLDFGAATTPSGVWAPFMILEWLDGRSLADDLTERRAQGLRGRSLVEAFAILEPVVDGLSVAHERHVAHRDVKPANIFLAAGGRQHGAPEGLVNHTARASDGRAGRAGVQVKVLDFGIAKIMKEGESAGTKGTFASFTWLYATPEQLDPRVGATGLTTDVYAFTLVLTELLTDRPPIDEHDIIGIMKAATNPSQRPTPRTRGANIPDEIEDVCRRALAVDPKSRYSSIAELWSALKAARQVTRGATTLKPGASKPLIVHSTAAMPASASALPSTPRPSTAHPSTRQLPVATPAMSPAVGTRQPASAWPPAQQMVQPLNQPPGAITPQGLTAPPGLNQQQGVITPHGLTAPPGLRAPPFTGAPSAGAPPDYYGRPSAYGASPPPGTAPPGYSAQQPPARAKASSNIVAIVAIVAIVVLVIVLVGAYAALHQGSPQH